jgi:glycosyltransferase involved in cell wall biosynthesis
VRIIQVVPSLEEEASGPSYSVPRLAEALAALGHDVTLTSAGGQAVVVGDGVRFERYPRDFQHVPIVQTLQLSEGLRRALRRHAAEAEIVHSNGLWIAPTLYPAWAARGAGRPLMLSPRGTLSPVALEKSARRKRYFWRLLQGPAVAAAKVLHATSEQEYLDIRAFGLTQPVALIPNGVDIAPGSSRRTSRVRKRLLYLGRVHPIKGLEILLPAWRRLCSSFPNWELRIVGPGPEDYERKVRAMIAEQDIQRVSLEGPRYGAEKSCEYAEADLFILPSFSENFGMTVAEALAHAVPVIATTGTPWAGLVEERCGWHVAPTEDDLARSMSEAMGLAHSVRTAMGANGRRWMEQRFGWAGLAEQFADIYRWAAHGGSRPKSLIFE